MPMQTLSEKHSHNMQKNGPGGQAAMWNCLNHTCQRLEDELPQDVDLHA